jgi:hypothetical protein
VVNYDLPWNPQRIEQRIGRCHRYGQKHDVVVVNFLNQKNEADLRVLPAPAMRSSSSSPASSAPVMKCSAAIESGVDFEKRIAAIYQTCRKPERDQRPPFDQLQLELNFEISEAMTSTRRKLLENFDDEVRDKLKVRDDASRAFLSRFERQFIQLTQHELRDHAAFPSDSSFVLHTSAFPGVPLGLYELPRRSGDAHLYRLGHPLAEHVITQAKERELPLAEVQFSYADHGSKISILESLRGQSGSLTVSLFSVESMDQAEDHLICAACTDAGTLLDEEQARRMLSLPASVAGPVLDLPAPSHWLSSPPAARPNSSATSPNAMPFSTKPKPRSSTAGPMT